MDSLNIKNCVFDRIGGNAIYITDYGRNIVIQDNEIKWTGDSGIVLNGVTGLNDGTKGTQPRRTRILR